MGSPIENHQQKEEQAMYLLEIHMEDYQTDKGGNKKNTMKY